MSTYAKRCRRSRFPDWRGHRIIEHGGAWQGFKAHISRYVDDKMTVILFANQIKANQTKLAHGVAALFNPELAQN